MRAALDRAGLSDYAASIKAAGHGDLVRNFFRAGREEYLPSAENLAALAAVLAVSPEWLLFGTPPSEPLETPTQNGAGATTLPAPPELAAAPDGAMGALRRPDDVMHDLPVYKTVPASIGQDKPGMAAGAGFIVTADIIDQISRPARLAAARGCYAVYIEADVMAPAFAAGALVIACRDRPCRPGDDVIAKVRAEAGPVAVLRRLVARDGAGVTLAQFNPAAEITVATADILSLDKVLTLADLV
mgnify:CR=1 FL=1